MYISIANKNCNFRIALTPSNNAKLKDVSAYVRVENLHQGNVHVDGLQAHPGEGCEKEEMQKDRHRHAQPLHLVRRQPAVQKKHHIEEEQWRAEIHQDLGGIVPSQLPVEFFHLRMCWMNKRKLNFV